MWLNLGLVPFYIVSHRDEAWSAIEIPTSKTHHWARLINPKGKLPQSSKSFSPYVSLKNYKVYVMCKPSNYELTTSYLWMRACQLVAELGRVSGIGVVVVMSNMMLTFALSGYVWGRNMSALGSRTWRRGWLIQCEVQDFLHRVRLPRQHLWEYRCAKSVLGCKEKCSQKIGASL